MYLQYTVQYAYLILIFKWPFTEILKKVVCYVLTFYSTLYNMLTKYWLLKDLVPKLKKFVCFVPTFYSTLYNILIKYWLLKDLVPKL